MPAVHVDIAEAVKDTINGSSLSLDVAATRDYVVVEAMEDIGELVASVVPWEESSVRLSRRDDDFTYVVRVTIAQRFDAPDLPGAGLPMTVEEIDARMLLAQEIMDLFRNKGLAGVDNVTCTATERTPVFSPDHIDTQRTFITALLLTFKKVREKTV
jgi:hypothetical protein